VKVALLAFIIKAHTWSYYILYCIRNNTTVIGTSRV